MLNQAIKSKISNLWNMFWAAGISNPLTALEQISYLLFIRRAEDVGLVKEPSFRWSEFTKNESELNLPEKMQEVFEYLKSLHDTHEPFVHAMQDAKFIINKPSLLKAAIELINDIHIEAEKERAQGQYFQDTLGDFYELILNQTGEAGKNGQFRTPRHIIHFMCEILAPTIDDRICDVTCGTSGFLVGAYQYIITQNSKEEGILDVDGFLVRSSGNKVNPTSKRGKKLINETFYGYDIDPTMIRLGMMNLMMHNIKTPHIKQIDSLSQRFDDEEKGVKYSKILANPPFTGRIDSLDTSAKLTRVYPLKVDKQGKRQAQNMQSELLFLERILELLEVGGKAAVVVPEGVLFGGSIAYKNLRGILLRDSIVEAIISLPSGSFKPYTGVKTSVLIFTKKGLNRKDFATKKVWFYDLLSDGYTLDDNRKKLKDNPLPEAVSYFAKRKEDSQKKAKKHHFFVEIEEIKKNDFDLSLNRYKDFDYVTQKYDPPQEILKHLIDLENQITKDLLELKDLIG